MGEVLGKGGAVGWDRQLGGRGSWVGWAVGWEGQ